LELLVNTRLPYYRVLNRLIQVVGELVPDNIDVKKKTVSE